MSQNIDLMETVEDLIAPIGALVISNRTGLPISWCKSIKEGRVKNPSAARVQILIEKLSGKTIQLSE